MAILGASTTLLKATGFRVTPIQFGTAPPMFMATPYVQFGEVLAPLYDSRPVSQRPILFAAPAATSVPTPVLKTTQRQPCTINSKKATPIKPIHKPVPKK